MEAGVREPFPVFLGHRQLSKGGESREESGKENIPETRSTELSKRSESEVHPRF